MTYPPFHPVSQTDKRAVQAIHTVLMDRFPRAFPQDYDALRPLKVGILADLIQRAPDLDPVLLRRGHGASERHPAR